MRKIHLVVLLALVSLIGGSKDVAGGQTPGNDVRGQAFAFPNDSRLLFDQVRLEIKFSHIVEPFIVTTRPAQHLVFSIAEKNAEELVKKYSIQIVPRVAGGARVPDREQDLVVADRYRIIVNCLEETPLGQSALPLTPSANCRPRNKNSRGPEDVLEMETFEDIRIGDVVPENNIGISFKILDYMHGAPSLAEENNPFSKICFSMEDVKICGCRISVGGRVRSAGCQ